MFAPRRLVEALVTEQVACVVIGGVALTLHGSARATVRVHGADYVAASNDGALRLRSEA